MKDTPVHAPSHANPGSALESHEGANTAQPPAFQLMAGGDLPPIQRQTGPQSGATTVASPTNSPASPNSASPHTARMHTLMRAGDNAGLNEYVAQNRVAIETEPMAVRWLRRYAPRLIEAWRTTAAPTGTRHPQWTEAQMNQLTAIARGGFPDRAQVQAFAGNHAVGNDERLRVIGRLMAMAGQAEYILGSMRHQDGPWETMGPPDEHGHSEGTNSGPMVDDYRHGGGLGEARAWCTAFVGYLHGLAGFRQDIIHSTEIFNSNSRLRGWHADGQQHGSAHPAPDSRTDGVNDYTNYSGSTIAHDAWMGLRNQLRTVHGARSLDSAAKEAQVRQILSTFFSSHPAPQAGDILVVNYENGRAGNGENHTTMVETFDAAQFTISTVEGNNMDAVRGVVLDLKRNPDAVHARTVADISSMHRLGLEFFTATPAARPSTPAAPAAPATPVGQGSRGTPAAPAPPVLRPGQGRPGTPASGTPAEQAAGQAVGVAMIAQQERLLVQLRTMAQAAHAVNSGSTVAEMAHSSSASEVRYD